MRSEADIWTAPQQSLKAATMVDLNRSLSDVLVLPLAIEEAPAPRASWCNVL